MLTFKHIRLRIITYKVHLSEKYKTINFSCAELRI